MSSAFVSLRRYLRYPAAPTSAAPAASTSIEMKKVAGIAGGPGRSQTAGAMRGPEAASVLSLLALAALLVLPVVAPLASARVWYDNLVKAGGELYNVLGMKLTGVYSQVRFAYDDAANRFVLEYTSVRNWAWRAWWCFTCFAYIKDTATSLTPTRLYDRALWEQGSWNVRYVGYNEIELKVTTTPGVLYVDVWVYFSDQHQYRWPRWFERVPLTIVFVVG